MSHTLLLMRHATAAMWSDEGDHGRPLTAEGRDQAARAASALAGLQVDRVLCSTARRTRETLAALGVAAPVEYLDALYEADPATIAPLVEATDEAVGTLLVVGHSPGMPGLATELVYSHDREQVDAVTGFQTATVARIELDGPWALLRHDPTLRLAGVTHTRA